MQPPRNINGIPLQHQVPLLGQQQQQHIQAQVQAALGQLAMQIYREIVAGVFAVESIELPRDNDYMQRLAKESIEAAKCYFLAIGAIKEEEGDTHDHPNTN